MPTATPPVCLRIEALRSDLFGDRGKSEMARRLDIRPSTYDRYERDRVPPADLLVRISDVCNVSLEWLITGEGPRHPERIADVEAEVLTRHFKDLVISRPSFRPIAREFFAWVESLPVGHATEPAEQTASTKIRVPIIGRLDSPATARQLAIIADLSEGSAPQLASLSDSSSANSSFGERIAPAKASLLEGDQTASAAIEFGPTDETGRIEERAIVFEAASLNPAEASAWVSFLVAGDLMAPTHPAGSYVIVDPSRPATAGTTCVAKRSDAEQLVLRRFQPEHDDVLLVPEDLRGEVERVPASDLQFVWNVVGTVSVD